MPAKNWAITDSAIGVIDGAIERFTAEHTRPGFAFYPLISWTEGGWASRSGGPKLATPDRYEISLIRQSEIGATTRWIRIKSRKFGVVAVAPRIADVTAGRRLVDFDGQDIVIR